MVEPTGRRRLRVRPWVRAIHRDVGYLAVGLTIVYAVSGLAVNHIADWDPNFKSYERVHELGPLVPPPGAGAAGEPGAGPAGESAEHDEAIARVVRERLELRGEPREVYRADETTLEIVYDDRTLHVDTASGRVVDQGQKPRLLLRAANWLHLNRGKKAWTYIADGYAVLLLYLAISGMFMLPGRKGFLGRGAILVLIGAAVPIAYVAWSGGP